MTTAAKDHFTRFGDVWSTGGVAELDELFPADVAYHVAPFPDMDRAALAQFITAFHQAFPDFRLTVDEQLRDGDTTTHRWTASATYTGDSPLLPGAATGKTARVPGCHIVHWRNGQPVEVWHYGDWLGWLQQCGVLPPLG